MNFSHLDSEGAARMVDVGEKPIVRRTAVAGGAVRMSPETVALLRDTALPKGDVLSTARIAGVMAAKKTPELIPLCHGLNLTSVDVDFEVGHDHIGITATARVSEAKSTWPSPTMPRASRLSAGSGVIQSPIW